MRPLTRAQRIAVVLWLVVGLVVWNGVYDLMIVRGIKEFLFRTAMYHAGRGPQISIASVMDVTVRDAAWVATLWSGLIMLAGLFTIRMLAHEPRTPNPEP